MKRFLRIHLMLCLLAVAVGCVVIYVQITVGNSIVREKPSPAVATVHPNPVAAVPVITKEPDLTDKQKIALLRAEAHKRGLRWSVTCVDYEQPDAQFFAMAADKRVSPDATYIEDGALPWWAVDGVTQADAAYNLYLSIQQPPNIHPVHRSEELKHHKLCPPQLRGE